MRKVEEKKIEMNQTGTEMKGDITEEERKELYSRMTEKDKQLFIDWFVKYKQPQAGTRPIGIDDETADEVHKRMKETKERLNISNKVLNKLMASVFYEYAERKKAMREIKEIRKKTGLTQKAFGKKYGIPERTIQDWETGKRKPADYVIRMLSQTTETNISERQIFEVFDFGFEQMETNSLIPSQSDKKTIYTKDDFRNGKMKKFNRYPIWKFEEEFAVTVSFR